MWFLQAKVPWSAGRIFVSLLKEQEQCRCDRRRRCRRRLISPMHARQTAIGRAPCKWRCLFTPKQSKAVGEGSTVWIWEETEHDGQSQLANVLAVDRHAEQSRLLRIKLEAVHCLNEMQDCNFVRLPRFCLHQFIFTASIEAETSVLTKIQSNHFLNTTLKYVFAVTMNVR